MSAARVWEWWGGRLFAVKTSSIRGAGMPGLRVYWMPGMVSLGVFGLGVTVYDVRRRGIPEAPGVRVGSYYAAIYWGSP